jgi:DNA-binding CsgD family transcriptional regulator
MCVKYASDELCASPICGTSRYEPHRCRFQSPVDLAHERRRFVLPLGPGLSVTASQVTDSIILSVYLLDCRPSRARAAALDSLNACRGLGPTMAIRQEALEEARIRAAARAGRAPICRTASRAPNGSTAVDRLSGILNDLYAGTLDAIAWDRAMVSIADLVRGSAAYLFAFSPATGQVLRDENHRGDPRALADYRTHWSYQDCRVPPLLQVPVGYAATEQTLLDMSNWRRTAVLNEFLLPVDSPHAMPVWLHKTRNKAVTLSIQGTRKRGPFQAADVFTLQQLAPHVARALAIRDRLDSLRVRADSLARTLDRTSFGVVVLDAAGCVLEANAFAGQLLSCHGSGVHRKADGTFSLRGHAGAQLQRWIRAQQAPPTGSDGLLHVQQPSGSSISVLVTPLPSSTQLWIANDPRWLVLLFNPDRGIQASRELIQSDLCVSMREAELAALLVSGCTLREASIRLRISFHTARSHLKAILRKAGLRSQSDLIRRIATGPALQHTCGQMPRSGQA